MKKSYDKLQLFVKNFSTGQVFTNAPQLEQVLNRYMELQSGDKVDFECEPVREVYAK